LLEPPGPVAGSNQAVKGSRFKEKGERTKWQGLRTEGKGKRRKENLLYHRVSSDKGQNGEIFLNRDQTFQEKERGNNGEWKE
jgi:hypothetical protein